MKSHLRGTFITLFVGLVIATILISNEGHSSKTVVLDASELKPKMVTIAKAEDTGIKRYDINTNRFTGFLFEIKDPKRIKVGYSKSLGRKGETTSNIAKDNKAIIAINGGGFRDEAAAIPEGIIMSKGDLIFTDNKKVKTSVMAINKNGVLIVGKYSLEDLKSLEVTEAISFGPCIVVNGVGQISGDGGQGVSPRTAIGQKKDGTIILLVIDGRQGLKVGATLKEVQNIMLEQDVWNATNLDGGKSSTMYYNNSLINEPYDSGERAVASIVYVTP